jgi:hypothetical protein
MCFTFRLAPARRAGSPFPCDCRALSGFSGQVRFFLFVWLICIVSVANNPLLALLHHFATFYTARNRVHWAEFCESLLKNDDSVPEV